MREGEEVARDMRRRVRAFGASLEYEMSVYIPMEVKGEAVGREAGELWRGVTVWKLRKRNLGRRRVAGGFKIPRTLQGKSFAKQSGSF